MVMLADIAQDGRASIWPVIHVLDREANKEVIVFETAPVEPRKAEEKGEDTGLHVHINWRYVVAVTNGKLFLWDLDAVRCNALFLMRH